MKVLSILHDPEARLLPLFKKVKENIGDEFQPTVVAYSPATNKKIIAEINNFGFRAVKAGFYGESRKKALEIVSKNEKGPFLYCDFDKIIHWYLESKKEFVELLNKEYEGDYLILGRAPKAFSTYPNSWQKTESIINHLMTRIFRQEMDAMTADCVLSHQAAKIICRHAKEINWGSCVEWPLLVYKHGLKIDYQEFEGLSWEDPERFKKEIKNSGGLKKWQDEIYDSVKEWEKRISSVVEQISVIKRLL